jgi:hypothetical protein
MRKLDDRAGFAARYLLPMPTITARRLLVSIARQAAFIWQA